MQWGSASEFCCDGRVRPLCLDLVCGHGTVYGVGSARPCGGGLPLRPSSVTTLLGGTIDETAA